MENGDALGGVGVGLGEVASPETVPEDSVPAGAVPIDGVPAGDGFPAVRELAVAAGETGVVAGTGSAVELEDFCAEAGGSDADLGSG